MKRKIFVLLSLISVSVYCQQVETSSSVKKSGNPILTGWYADPEGVVFGNEYWIFPTFSSVYEKEVFIDAFSSKDLITWEKHSSVIDTSVIKWAHRAMWAPSIVEKQNKFYLFFSANDLQKPGGPYWDPNDSSNHKGGIGIAVADSPGGPYKDYLGKPIVDEFHNNAQPIDQFVFYDNKDGKYYLIYGGWKHCNIAQLNDDFTGFIPFEDGTIFKEVTPQNYVEGPFMFFREGKYYFMWSEGDWGKPDYSVAYAVADKPTGPFNRVGKILQEDPEVATSAGHHSIIKIPNEDRWYIVYHRRPVGETARDYRVVCIDRMYFDENGKILPIKMTKEGVEQYFIK